MDLKFLKVRKQVLFILLGGLILASSFGGGYWAGKSSVPSVARVEGVYQKETPEGVSVDFNLFWDVWERLESTYYEPEELDPQEMVYGAIRGLVKSTEDPYTNFMKPETSKSFEEDISGSFEGIGAEIGIKDEILTVIAPLKDTPAERAGLQSGDKIVEVDGDSTSDWSVQEAVNKIRGPKDTPVVLTILRDNSDGKKEIEVVRGEIEIPVVEWELKEDNVAYVQIYNFTQNSPQIFKDKAQQILSSRAEKIVLDLRNNPGGYLDAAVEIAGWFTDSGEVVAIEEFKSKSDEYKARGPSLLKEFPLVILINEGSASASEILAAALRYHEDAKIVGKQSFGKGTVQTLEDFKGGSSLKVTIAKWLTPAGKSISQEGVAADIEIEFTDEDLEAGKDPQLKKALELLRND